MEYEIYADGILWVSACGVTVFDDFEVWTYAAELESRGYHTEVIALGDSEGWTYRAPYPA